MRVIQGAAAELALEFGLVSAYLFSSSTSVLQVSGHQFPVFIALLASVIVAACRSEEPAGGQEGLVAGDSPEPKPPVISHPYPGDPDEGREVYMEFCAKCHQPDGSGFHGTLAANLVTEKSRLAKSNADLLNSIRHGVTIDDKYMPPMKHILSEQEMKDALSYVRFAFGD